MATAQRLLFLAFLLFGMAGTLTAQTTWTGTTSTNWNTPGNWTAGIPTATSDVVIPDVTNDPVISVAGAVARSVTVQPGGLLTLATTGGLSISDAATTALINKGTVVNNGAITISNLAEGSSYGILNELTFTNAAGATINIDGVSTTGTALRNSTPGVFDNRGTIVIGGNSATGRYGIDNYSTFNNYKNAAIHVDRVSIVSIQNYLSFENTGIIKIGAKAYAGGTGILNERSLFNETGGEIHIDRVGYFGINNSGIPWGVENLGSIRIGALPGGNTFTVGIRNAGNMRIIAGSLTIDRVSEGMSLESISKTENYATVTIGEIASVPDMLTGLGRFNNTTNAILKGTGSMASTTMQNANGTLSPGYSAPGKMSFDGPQTLFSNSCIFAIEVNGTGTAGVDYDQFVMENGKGSIGAKLALTVNYTPTIGDRVTIVRGTIIEGQLYPTTALPSGWKLEYGNNKIDLVYDGVPSATTWTGAVNNDWNTAGNWSAGIPGAVTDVTIPDVANDPVISTATARASYVNVYTGALLTVANTGVLTINGASLKGLHNQGTTQNNGTITIGNLLAVGTNGLYNSGSFNNNTGGIINIDRATATALYNAYGTFSNAGTIVIGANAASGADGIDNDAIFNNIAGGIINIDRVTSAGIYNNGTTFTNAGTITMGSLSGGNTINWGVYSDKPFTNSGGQINIDRVSAALAANAGTINNSGTITIGAVAPVTTLLSNTGTGTFSNDTGGMIRGTGSIDATRFVNAGGGLAPGYSPGTITFTGNETFSNSTLYIEAKGTAVPGTDYDQVVVNGSITVGGNLVISTIDGFSLAPGQTLNFITGTAVTGSFASVTWPAGVTGTIMYSTNSISLNVLSALPLTLLEFTGQATNNTAILKWKTAEELNTLEFDIERSADGLSFTKIGTVAARGSGASHYSMTDESPAAGNNFYRLKMKDIDGQFTYSKLIQVKFAGIESLLISPVPATHYINIRLKEPSLAGQYAQVYNANGNLVANIVLSGITRIGISGWPAGIYHLKTSIGTYRFAKQ